MKSRSPAQPRTQPPGDPWRCHDQGVFIIEIAEQSRRKTVCVVLIIGWNLVKFYMMYFCFISIFCKDVLLLYLKKTMLFAF